MIVNFYSSSQIIFHSEDDLDRVGTWRSTWGWDPERGGVGPSNCSSPLSAPKRMSDCVLSSFNVAILSYTVPSQQILDPPRPRFLKSLRILVRVRANPPGVSAPLGTDTVA